MTDAVNHFKSGFVAIVGRPNVGKSTLVNALLAQKIAAVSPKPQTTRRRQLGIYTSPAAQIIFVDTPGMHQPLNRLGEFMNEEAQAVLEDADVIVWIVDASQPPNPNNEDRMLAETIADLQNQSPVILALNKADLLSPAEHAQTVYQQFLPQASPLFISAKTGKGCEELLRFILQHLPEGPQYYAEEQVTDLYEREIAADLIREAALLHLRAEVPHSLAVRIDTYEDRSETQAYIASTLFVARESHKGIVIGKGGEMLKAIGSSARQEIETLTGRKVYLELRVKVSKNWRNDLEMLRRLGYVTRKKG